MRSSSLKTAVATFSIVVTLVLATPASAANRNQSRQNRGNRGDLVVRVVKFIKRLGGITTFGLPTVPTGEPVTPQGTPTPTGPDTNTDTTGQ